MKKIILFLCLLTGVEIKSQIVGGVVTSNNTTTLTNKTLTSPTITGSPNLKGTLTGTGAINTTGAITTTGVVTGGSFRSAGTYSSGAGTSTFNSIVIPSQSVSTGILVYVDATGNFFPFVIDGTNGGTNPEAIIQGSLNARVTLKNTTTGVRWLLSNNTLTTGIGLDGLMIGTNSLPNLFNISNDGTKMWVGVNPANTTTLGGLTLGYNTTSGMMHFGKFNATSNSIWGYHTSTPTTSNYNLNFDANNMYLQAPTNLNFVINGTQKFTMSSTLFNSAVSMSVGSTFTANGTITGQGNANFTGSVSASNLASGTYTPTLFNTTNIAASTAYQCQYMRIGNVVTVSGKVDIDVTLAASAASELGMSLPIASNFTAEENCGGDSNSDAIASEVARIKADATNDRASFVFKAISLTNDSYSFSFTYLVQ